MLNLDALCVCIFGLLHRCVASMCKRGLLARVMHHSIALNVIAIS